MSKTILESLFRLIVLKIKGQINKNRFFFLLVSESINLINDPYKAIHLLIIELSILTGFFLFFFQFFSTINAVFL